MSGGQDYQQLRRAEEVRQRLLAGAREGEFYEVGRQAADLLLAEQAERERQALKQQAIREFVAQEQAAKQARIDQEARQYPPEVLDAAQARFESDPDRPDPQDFDASAARWRTYAQEEARKRAAKRLSDEDIAEMSAEEWESIYDVDKGRFKKGWEYVPDAGSGFGSVNAAAAGLSGTAIDLRRHPG